MINKIKIFLCSKFYILNSNNGIAAIVVILTLTALILAIGLAITSVAVIENEIALSQKQAIEAYFYAENGILDAKIKITRNKNYTSASDTSCSGGICAITFQTSPLKKVEYTVSGTDTKTIIATGISETKSKKIQVVISVNSNGKLTITDWQEIE